MATEGIYLLKGFVDRTALLPSEARPTPSSFFDLIVLALNLSTSRLCVMSIQLGKFLLMAVAATPHVLSSATVLQPTPPMGKLPFSTLRVSF